ncbi:palmitoyltransferase ZDHHC22-like [Belonocnema kinseyi]|uniref:palmitoyltransferase ZDHHC22-like n=1 Tax=Belonocnema kinseyi TaxID=2817044 RepID=UPI00143D745B|nr:palmitoyltransferase ZDHHC22-like [Belonocnema kinseyi]
MKIFYTTILKICPVLAFLFSIISIFTTIYISAEVSPIFAFFSIQIYLNWYSAYKIAKSAATLKIENLSNQSTIININQRQNSILLQRETKFWYCEKCQSYTRRATYHCPVCKKCYHFRDHHCFFMGTCVLRQNMGNFILICLYSALMCFYSFSILGPYLYQHLHHFFKPGSSFLNNLLSFCFPVALARFLFSGEESCLLLVTLFDVQVSTFCVGIFYGFWKLGACLSGKQNYSFHSGKEESFRDIFGSRGIWNFLFPFDGLLGPGFNKSCELKQV